MTVPAILHDIILSDNTDPSFTASLTLSVNRVSGTFSYALFKNELPVSIKEELSLQGLLCTVEQLTVIDDAQSPGVKIEGRILPKYKNELVYLNFPKKEDGTLYRINEILDKLATKVNTHIVNEADDAVTASFEFKGRFTDALRQLATLACGELTQQNDSWFILTFGNSRGEFLVPAIVHSYQVVKSSNVLSELMDLIQSAQETYIEILRAQVSLIILEAQDLTQQQDNKAQKEFMAKVTLDFGSKDGSMRMIPNDATVLGLNCWENWAIRPGDTASPIKQNDKYFKVEALAPTGNGNSLTTRMRGLRTLHQASVLVEVQKPENAAGTYYAYGNLKNLSVTNFSPPGAISQADALATSWCQIPLRTETVNVLDVDGHLKPMTKTFVELSIDPYVLETCIGTGGSPTTAIDKMLSLHYSADLTLAYHPFPVKPWKYRGTLDRWGRLINDSNQVILILINSVFYKPTPECAITLPSIVEMDTAVNMPRNTEAETTAFAQLQEEWRHLTSEWNRIKGSVPGYTPPIVIGMDRNEAVVRQVGTWHIDSSMPTDQSVIVRFDNTNDYIGSVYKGNVVDTNGDPRGTLTVKNEYGVEDARLLQEQDLRNTLCILQAKYNCLQKRISLLGGGVDFKTPIEDSAKAWKLYDDLRGAANTAYEPTALLELKTTAIEKTEQLFDMIADLRRVRPIVSASFTYDGRLPLPGQKLRMARLENGRTEASESVINSFSFDGTKLSIEGYGTIE